MGKKGVFHIGRGCCNSWADKPHAAGCKYGPKRPEKITDKMRLDAWLNNVVLLSLTEDGKTNAYCGELDRHFARRRPRAAIDAALLALRAERRAKKGLAVRRPKLDLKTY